MKKALLVVILLALAVVAYRSRERLFFRVDRLLPDESETVPGEVSEESGPAIETVADGLDIPWEIAFLPEGDMLVTERPGRLLRVERGESSEVQGVHHIGEGGLLGMALHPSFRDNRYLYLYLTTREGGRITNRVDRYRYEDGRLEDRTTIVQNIPGAQYHDGGRIAFGPDGKLYVTTGDAGEPFLAQDRASLAGKILRLNDDGSVPGDNPFGNPVWSYGHRNPQGLAWDPQGRLWATEHGRSGIRSGFDEINRIERGKNYGWPTIEGDETAEGVEAPFHHSGEDETWAPAGAVWHKNSLFFAGLRGETLYQVVTDKDSNEIVVVGHFIGEYGRLRAVVRGPDGDLYLTTSNTDGRGTRRSGDDRVLRIRAEALRVPAEILKRFR